MASYFTAAELADLTQQVDAQLGELDSPPVTTMRAKSVTMAPEEPPQPEELPPKQRLNIEKTAQQPADQFLHKLAATAKNLLCHANSDLQKQYEMFGHLKKDELLEKIAGCIAVLGFSGIALQVLSVAVAVYILHIGVKAFSSKYCQ